MCACDGVRADNRPLPRRDCPGVVFSVKAPPQHLRHRQRKNGRGQMAYAFADRAQVCCAKGSRRRVHAASLRMSSPSAVTCPPAARIIERIVSTVMFWRPLRMRPMETPLSVGTHRSPNSAFVIAPGRLRY
jgi:hypothetical protein